MVTMAHIPEKMAIVWCPSAVLYPLDQMVAAQMLQAPKEV
jgi:hypothetical protein